MKILVVGTGAREHALTLALSRDPQVTELHAAPGNPGIGALATLHAVDPLDGAAVAALATSVGADLVVVGPEAPLVAGVSDAVRAAGVPVFGPSAEAARLEGSKAFAKEVMAAAGVPTADPVVVTEASAAEAALDTFGAPYVVKDDGLAAGKGVVVTEDRAVALEHALACLAKPGGRVVVEDYLDGPEVSLFVLSDGTHVVPLVPAQDFKRVGDADTGPNTGGMGAYTPLPWAPAGLVAEVVAQVAQPTVDEMARRGTPFVGVLYCGLALTSHGTRVVEFNARFGDPDPLPDPAHRLGPRVGGPRGRRHPHREPPHPLAGRHVVPAADPGVGQRAEAGPGRRVLALRPRGVRVAPVRRAVVADARAVRRARVDPHAGVRDHRGHGPPGCAQPPV